MPERSFQEKYYLHEPGLLRRVCRDVRYLGYVLKVVYYWAILGSGVRRAYRRAESRNEMFVIDTLDAEDI